MRMMDDAPFEIVCTKEETEEVLKALEYWGIQWISGSKPTKWNPSWFIPDKYPLIVLHVDYDKTLRYEFTDYESLPMNYMSAQRFLAKYKNEVINEVMTIGGDKEMENFSKDDLKDWMIVETAEHSIFLVDKTHGYLIYSGEHMLLSNYTDDLKFRNSHDYSIVKVYEPKQGLEFFLKLYLDGTRGLFRKIEEDLNLIWERDEKPVEMTIAEIEEKLGVKNLKVVKEK